MGKTINNIGIARTSNIKAIIGVKIQESTRNKIDLDFDQRFFP